MNASTHQLFEDVEVLYIAVPHIKRAYPSHVPNNFEECYSTFYSQNFPVPPTRQGIPGDFFVATEDVYLNDEQGHWKVAHFSRLISHPCIDNLFLCYDRWGPLWTTRSPSPLSLRISSSGFRPISVSTHFYATLALYHRQQSHCEQGNVPNDPIYVDD